MQLQDRDLYEGLQGDDVALLQHELRQLGLEIEGEDGVFGPTTLQAVLAFQESHRLETTGIVDERTAIRLNQAFETLPAERRGYVVHGYVREPDGRPSIRAMVRAVDKDLRHEERLGEATTNRLGYYQIAYNASQFRRAEKKRADLIVRVINRETEQELIASPIRFNAQPVERVDLMIGGEAYRGPSEYEQLIEELSPLLEDLEQPTLVEKLAELNEEENQDISFLSGETGRNLQHIAFLAESARLARRTGLPPEVFYGFARQNLPMMLEALLGQHPTVLRSALETALAENIIPAQFGEDERIEQFLERRKELLVEQAFVDPIEPGRSSLGALLATTIENPEQQRIFLTAYVDHQGPIRDFWNNLRETPEFRDCVDDLQFALQLGALTANHVPLVREIQRMRRDNQPVKRDRRITTLRDLTLFNEEDWQKLIRQEGIECPPDVPGDEGDKIRNYAHAMARMLEDAFPTTFIANRIAEDEIRGKTDLLAFFENNKDFDLTTTRLTTYLDEHPTALDDIADADVGGLKDRIQAIQRLYKVTPSYAPMRVLMQDGLDSAHAITRMGPTVFMAKFGEALAKENMDPKQVYERAEQVAATALTLFGTYGMGSSKVSLQAVPDKSAGNPQPVPGIPDWPTLFGGLELCECEHCRSVYSPAAYLVDILHFLKDRRLVDQITRDEKTGRITNTYKTKVLSDGKQADKSAKDVLFERRPDIGGIELTCENTNTPLPYVDLVNEVLENAVAPIEPDPFTPFTLPVALADNLDQRNLSNLINAFPPPNPSLSPHAVVTVKKKGEWWTIDDLPFTYTIRKEKGQLSVTARSLQTSGTVQERAANPQYINRGAYDKLKKQVFPWSLPFDLWVEEARAYLGHLGMRRYQLMETFLPGDHPTLLVNVDIAHEYLGLTGQEAKLINGTTTSDTEATTPGEWNLWGFDKLTGQASLDPQDPATWISDPADNTKWINSDHWLNDVLTQRIDVFLQQSGLKYLELLELLGTYYINPFINGARKIKIVSKDPENPTTCELSKLTLEGFDQADAMKTVRFVRLWRKLGWTMRELDLAITALHPRDQNGNPLTQSQEVDKFLVRLAHVERLRNQFDVPIDRLLSFWAPVTSIDLLLGFWTSTYTDHSAAGQPKLPSLYGQLFRNKAVINPLNPYFPEDANKLDQDQKLSDHIATIIAALEISANEFTLLLNEALVIPRIQDPNDPTKTILDDKLTLAHLSRLCRHATLAKALGLPIREYLSALKLIGDPFAATAETVLFVERVSKIRSSGFTVPELDYLLRHEFVASSGVAPTEETIALILDEIRTGLQTIAAENTFDEGIITDLNGDLTRKKLALLNWDSALIEQAIATLNDSVTYEATLAALSEGVVLPNDTGTYEVGLDVNALPAGFTVPEELKGVVDYDAAAQKLKALRALTQDERTALANVAGATPQYQNAVEALFKLPGELHGRISYDSKAQKLRFTGAMTTVRWARLKTVPGGPDYQKSVDDLFWAPRVFVLRHMRTFAIETFVAPLAALPADLQFPAALKNKIYYDPSVKKLYFIGAMTESEHTALRILKNNEPDPMVIQKYQSAIDDLFNSPNKKPRSEDSFLTAPDRSAPAYDPNTDAGALFDNPITPADRFKYVLQKLMPYLRNTLSDRLIKQKVGEALKLEAETVDGLLTKWVNSPNQPKQKVIRDFRVAAFAESNPNIKLSKKVFGDQFNTFTLLHKIALIISKLKITPKQLRWVFDYGPGAAWLDPSTLPLSSVAPKPAIFKTWDRLVDLFQLRDALPLSETILDELFRLAHAAAGPGLLNAEKNTAKANYVDVLVQELQWTEKYLVSLVGKKDDHQEKGSLNLEFPDDYRDERALARLQSCFASLKRLGMSAELCTDLAKADVTHTAARSVIQAVKAKYSDEQWLKLAKPLRDVLREKQRAALVTCLVAHPRTIVQPGGTTQPAWRDVNDLYAHYLIDVEMSPCQLTSRIKQAISSVQLFVQRCLMNLEKEVSASAEVDVNWRQWKEWMKNYRVWEANRKIFLYPENWIEPELRDDKSPFFKEMENELLQNELTKENAETAFLHYLEKLDAVRRLEVVGMYHEVETDDGTSSGNKLVDILHVFGRTDNTSPVYYYRQRRDSAYWTAWERLDLDIEGDHLIPVVWNRRLYLFWPIFTEKQEEIPVTMPKEGQKLEEGKRYWEIQMAWSEYKNKRWSPKKITMSNFRSDAPFDKTKKDLSKSKHIFWATPSSNLLEIWHGWIPEASGPSPGKVSAAVMVENSFFFIECSEKALLGVSTFTKPTGILALPGIMPVGMMFVENPESPLYLPTPDAPLTLPVLENTPDYEPFRILYPHQDEGLTGRRPFFFQDNTRIFFITPQTEELIFHLYAHRPRWSDVTQIGPAVGYDHLKQYFEKPKVKPPLPPIPELEMSVSDPRDPLIFEPSYPIAAGSKATAEMATATAGLPSAIPGTGVGPGISHLSPPWSTELRPTISAGSGIAGNLFDAPPYTDMMSNIPDPPSVPFGWIRETRHLFQFEVFYHPYVCNFIWHLNRDGLEGLLQRPVQLQTHRFFEMYDPTDTVVKGVPTKEEKFPKYPKEDVDFSYGGAYAQYNWELFFHAPLLLADRLSKNQRFEEAQEWFHYIFDPTDSSSYDAPQRYWRTKRFFETTDEQYQKEKIPNLLRFLAKRGDPQELAKLTASEVKELEELEKQIREWRKKPFKPHLIARMRTTAYQKTVVMKYIDNLIAWGDQLFRRDTIESINEATQLYILAAEILGKRPEIVPPRTIPQVQTFNTLEPRLDEFSSALVQIEEFVPPSSGIGAVSTANPPPLPKMLYFCVPKNDKLLGYWDTVADRLFKIRHCMTIEGVVRQLPLFEPPIEPGLLVKAAAAGIDISSALNDINAALPYYRFNIMAQKASELCAEIKALGAALLSALEKRDAEALALLRSSHEITVLNAVHEVKKKQVEEADETLEGLEKYKAVVEARQKWYEERLKKKINSGEQAQLDRLSEADNLQHDQAFVQGSLILASLFPDVKFGAPTTMGWTWGSSNIVASVQSYANQIGVKVSRLSTQGAMSGTYGGYDRREEEWKHQQDLAAKELEQVKKQIAAAEIRKAIAEQELKNHTLQIENAKQVDAYMRDKFTNRELYDWMVGQISAIYFQSYQLAYDVAKRTERAYRHELGLQDSSFIQFGYWDSLKKGLLAGERLYHDIKRMEVAYLDQNRREYEITKHVSLAMLDPVALLQLKQTGECFVSLPEALFDLDYPGHYMRRIKSVSLTIPCVTGPYTSVSCTLTLLKSSIRTDSKNGDNHFKDMLGAVQSIVTSSAQNDSGLFEFNLRDERYLPFEGAGVISDWHLELSGKWRGSSGKAVEFPQFDFDTISDVILHFRYTAREGGDLLKQKAVEKLQGALDNIVLTEERKGLFRLFSMRHEFSGEWHRFLHPADTTADHQALTIKLTKERFPFQFQAKQIAIDKIQLFVKVESKWAAKNDVSKLKLSLEAGEAPSFNALNLQPWNGLLLSDEKKVNPQLNTSSPTITWTLTAWLAADGNTRTQPGAEALEEIAVLCHYSVK